MNDTPKPIDLGGTGDIDMDPDPTFRAIQQILVSVVQAQPLIQPIKDIFPHD